MASCLVGVDPDASSLKQNPVIRQRVVAVGPTLPFRDASFNLVTADMVFEHLEDPAAVLRDIRRVLGFSGICILHTVNARYWQTALGRSLPQRIKNLLVGLSEGREESDVYPTYYRFNAPLAIPRVLAEAGFAADQVMMLNTSSVGRILLFGPFVVFELLWNRMTRWSWLSGHRSNVIVIASPRRRRSERPVVKPASHRREQGGYA
jgi:SAM-dependent methyltransferase